MSKKINELYLQWTGHEHTQDYERNIYDSAQMLEFAEYCVEDENAELKRVNNKMIRALHRIKERDFEQLDRVCELAGVHKFSFMKADIEDALESAKGGK